ncbi:MAG: DNA polymerase III subunit alpha [Actinomycetota bacterium]|nr:DNA polymerase III subunit alpha [Actinomycetota bacterium]MDQ3647502.1 DNA polymerase III subunit alpha [Actinomycetota bacterium]
MSYVELHCHSAFSFLDGASHPVELAGAAAEQDYEAVALTDHDGIYGSMEFVQATKPLGVRAITGAEVTLDDGSHITLLCESKAGYRNLCRLLTKAHAHTRVWAQDAGDGWAERWALDGRCAHARERPAGGAQAERWSGEHRTDSSVEPKVGEPEVSLADVEAHAEGLICLSGCARDGAVARRVEAGDHVGAAATARRLLAAFGPERFRVELQRPFARHDRRRNRLLSELAERLGVPAVATGNVHAHDRSRTPLQDAFVAVRTGKTLDESEPLRRGNASHVLVSPEAMVERFADHPEAVHESGRLADRLRFDLAEDLGYRYPGSEDPTSDRRLAELCRHRLDERYAGQTTRAKAEARLDEELRVIASLELSGFFLLHRDLLELAREVAAEVRGPSVARALLPPGRGRGSSVSSIVCYLTGLSHVDPIECDLFLGRFLNEEIAALPDIDLDFPRDIRDVLIPRVHDRYGPERSALVAAFATFQVRSAIRDLAKSLGLPPGEIERLARHADPWQGNEIEQEVSEVHGATPKGAPAGGHPARSGSPRWQALTRLVRDVAGLPRHIGQHSGGMVISTQPLIDVCPVQPAAMEGRQMVQWDKDSCADAGFLKIDLLGLGMLSAVERCVDLIHEARHEHVDLSRIDFGDKEVYGEIHKAETTGVFQIESRAQMQMLKRTLPESLDDLTVQVALVRPGPILGGAVHPYIERKKRLREDPSYEVPYEHPSLEPVLKDTLGAIVFQDQVIEVAMAFAGFSPGEAEGLRRAMSRRRSEAAMRSYEEKFVAGGMAAGASEETARRVYDQILGFSGFGFPKAHSAAFGLLAYQSTWLRVHYRSEFLCALLNEQPMGFYPPDALAHEAQRRGITVLSPCVTAGAGDCTVEDSAVRLGLGYVSGVRAEEVKALVDERDRRPYRSIGDLASRSGAGPETLERLAWAGACDALVEGPVSERRRQALWMLGAAYPSTQVAGGRQLALPLDPEEAPKLHEMSAWDRMLADLGSTSVTLHEHPVELMRPGLGPGYVASAELERTRHGSRVRVAGLVVARQRPATAKGVTFMLLEDETGTINLIVTPPVYERHRPTVRAEPFVTASGRLERREGVTNILVDSIARLERPSEVPEATVKHIEPRRMWSTQPEEESAAQLRALAPAANSFGRGRGG